MSQIGKLILQENLKPSQQSAEQHIHVFKILTSNLRSLSTIQDNKRKTSHGAG